MKEIICSGKRIKDGKWIEGFYVKFYSNGEAEENHMIFTINEAEKSSQPYNVDPETVCRCTGLTDKNGRKIFEGDIVKHFIYPGDEERYVLGYIKWDSKHYRFIRQGTDQIQYIITEKCIYEVIGNIFDNPELLSGDKK